MGIKYLNQDKLERAKKSVNDPNNEVLVLEAYKKQGGAYEGELDGVKLEEKVEPVKKKRKK